MIDRQTIKDLAAAEDPWAASLYVPKREEDGKYQYDALAISKQASTIEERMEERGLKAKDRQSFRRRLDELLGRPHFFNRYQPGMLAVFVSPSRVEAVDVPVPMEEITYLSEEFYLRPIVSMLNDLERFLVVALGPESVYLYEGTPGSLVQSANLTPFSSETGAPDKLGQPRPGSGGAPPVHVSTYLRKVDDKLLRTVQDHDAPLIVAGPEWLCTAYHGLSNYPNVMSKGIPFQPEKDDREALLSRARPLVEEYLRDRKAAKRRSFIQEMLKGNASISLTDILAAAVNGQVAALYLDKDENTTGIYKPAIQFAKVGETKEEGGDTALFNLAAIKTFLRDGSVYDLPREDLPDSTTSINATFRDGGGAADKLT